MNECLTTFNRFAAIDYGTGVTFLQAHLRFDIAHVAEWKCLRLYGRPIYIVQHIQREISQTCLQLQEYNLPEYFEVPASLHKTLDDYCQIFGIESDPHKLSVALLLHEPNLLVQDSSRLYQPSVDPEDMTSIELPAPYFEDYEASARGIHFPC